MRAITNLALVIGLALIAPPSPAATGTDPFFGTWMLDRGHSHYAKEPPPEQMTIVIEPSPQGLSYRSVTRYVDGRTGTSLYSTTFDGNPALVVGTAGFLSPVSLHRVDGSTIEATYTSGLKKVAWSRWSINTDGTELVVTTTSLGTRGEEDVNVATFHRVRGS